ncbi:hypothetical protein CsatB_014132 [Cannabis sativa]|uniref:EF-hand domain-containing protein n=1 Tax=Cannabis sativa TaxID=3483 RepID=A0A7J6F8H2_CANSA|nr:hypothetical protein G4B88_013561 [Cannabis sativa]
MVLHILLLVILFIVGLFNLYFYVPTKKIYVWIQSLFISTNSSGRSTSASSKTSIDKSLLSPNKEKKMVNNNRKDELRKVFSTFDKNSDGFITKQELMESLRNIRIFMTEKEVEEMVLKLDANGDGLIDFEEFGLLCESMTGGGGGEQGKDEVNGNESLFENEEDLKEAFDVFDRDKDGRISVEELGSILSSLGLKEGKKMENCKEMIKKVDMDGDGMVNFEEFKSMMKSGGQLLLPSSC